MVVLSFFISLLSISLAAATPLPALKVPHVDPQQILCQIPIIKHFLCPAVGATTLTRATVLGLASGTVDPSGAYRYPVRYATANRWAPSKLVTSWGLPSGSTNVTTMPLACPQPGVDPSAYTEDCLSMILYVPPTLTLTSNAPILMWIHGGSFIVGSATAAGLDGSSLAIATGSIVAVVQYRLGALGFLSPDGTTNLALKDLVNAMQFLKTVGPAFGASSSKITLAGQSSGANMIRALLAAPSASSLFKSAILQSDPMNFGFLTPSIQQLLVSNFNGFINCGASDTSCQNALSLDTIINAELFIFGTAVNFAPGAGTAEPIRPVRDGTFITSTLDSTSPFPSVSKPILVTTVLNEAALAIYNPTAYPNPVAEGDFPPIVNSTFGPARSTTVLAAPFYAPVPSANGTVDARVQLQTLGTDYLWKCSTWTFARNWVQNGETAYVGQYIVGASYPGNDAVPFCTQPGVVCHQDDIEIVFGTVSNPTSAQSALVTQMQQSYKAFLNNGNPNAAGVPTWTAATTSDVHALQLGGSGEVPIDACTPSFWGQSVQYDYQFFNL